MILTIINQFQFCGQPNRKFKNKFTNSKRKSKTDLDTESGRLEFVEGTYTETRGGPQLVLRRRFGDCKRRLVDVVWSDYVCSWDWVEAKSTGRVVTVIWRSYWEGRRRREECHFKFNFIFFGVDYPELLSYTPSLNLFFFFL